MSTLDDRSLVQRLNSRRPLLWLNPHLAPAKTVLADLAVSHALTLADIEAADALLRRWAPALSHLFPELAASKRRHDRIAVRGAGGCLRNNRR